MTAACIMLAMSLLTLQASMLEIYNEEYKDLLAKKKLADGKSHKVRACRSVQP